MEPIVLYHGSRGGIIGNIKPESRIRCDFGCGFHMGTNVRQAMALVANDPLPYLYKLKLHLYKIPEGRILKINDMQWAYFVLYNRGKLEAIKGSKLYKQCRLLSIGKDLIVGPIADDAMNASIGLFIRGRITDKAFLESIRAIKYGTQYVAKSAAACSCIEIISEKELYGKELDDALHLSDSLRKEGVLIASEIQRKYRREGKFFDEIINDIQKRMFLERER